MDPQYLQSLHACLRQISAPTGGTEGIKNATRALNEEFYKSPSAVPGLFEVMATSDDASVRQLAAVELRKRVAVASHKHWKRLDQPIRNVIKARLLEMIAAGHEKRANRHAVARVLAEMAEVELSNKTWPELLQFLVAASNNASAEQREVAIFILYTLMDTVVDVFSNELPQIYALFAKALQDPDSLEVRITTVQALGRVAEYIEIDETTSISLFQQMVPAIINITGQSIEANDEFGAKKCFDTLESLLLLETPLLNLSLVNLVEFLINAGGNRQVDEGLRIMSLNSLLWTIKFKKGKVGQLELGKIIIDALVKIGAEDEPEDVDEDSVARTAYRCLDALATSLSHQSIFPTMNRRNQKAFASSEASLRKSAVMALGVMVEGCSLFIAPHMSRVWPFIDAGLGDADIRVRRASCSALTCICEVLGDETAKRHEYLLPKITPLLNDIASQRSAMTALDSLLESLDSTVIMLYLHPLMERLVPMLDTSPLAMKPSVVGAIGSAAYASKAAFLPYFEATMQRITPYLSLKEAGEEQDLRGVTQDTLGTLAQAVGKEAYRPYLDASLNVAFDAIALDSPQLRECSMIYFGVLAKVYEEEFVPYLPRIMPAVLNSLGQAEEDAEESDEKANAGQGFHIQDDEEAEDDGFVDVDVDSDSEEEMIKVTTAVALEKAVAADAVLDLFEHTKAAFLPYVEDTVMALMPLMQHFFPGSRKSAATTLLGFISTLAEVVDFKKPEGAGLAGCALTGEVKKLADAIIPEVISAWESDDESEVVSDIAMALTQSLEAVGAGIIAPEYLDRVWTYTLSILDRKALCQQDSDNVEDGEATGELSEVESALIISAQDLVGAMAGALGGDFAQAFNQFLPALSKFVSPSFSAGDRSNTVGALAECTAGLEKGVTPFVPQLLAIGLGAAADPDVDVQSNAAFLLGSLVYFSETDLGAQYLTILQSLQPMFTLKQDQFLQKSETCRDNAAGAIARMILKNKAALPLDQVVPVFFGALPLLRDFLEYGKCVDAICMLFAEQSPYVQAHFGHLLDVCGHVLRVRTEEDEAAVEERVRGQVVELLRAVAHTAGDELRVRGLDVFL